MLCTTVLLPFMHSDVCRDMAAPPLKHSRSAFLCSMAVSAYCGDLPVGFDLFVSIEGETIRIKVEDRPN
jgi:hypothetical protein